MHAEIMDHPDDVTSLLEAITQSLTLDDNNSEDNLSGFSNTTSGLNEERPEVSSSGSPNATQFSQVQLTIICQSSDPSGEEDVDVPCDRRNAHLILHLPWVPTVHLYNLETVDVSLISDKFPGGPDGLLQLRRANPQGGAFFLVKFWADLGFSTLQKNLQFLATSIYEGNQNLKITCSTRICSFGNAIGTKIEELDGTPAGHHRYLYQSIHVPLCDYLVNFITKLTTLDTKNINGVLEDFTVLQVVTNRDTSELLLCMAYVFEACPPESETGAAFTMYRLVGSENS